MDYELKLDQFKGPLDKLLELIEEKKLPISEISLASVTDEFLKYVEKIEKVDFGILADFISVASKLILIKSKSLLPSLELSEEEESDIKDLEKRLAIYKELKSAKKHLQDLWVGKKHGLSRPYLLNSSVFPVFSPGNITSQVLLLFIQKILEVAEKLTHETETIKEKIISIEDKISEIVERIAKIGEYSLHKLSGRTRSDMIATFLAVLHLARDQMVRIKQEGQFSEILITKA